MRKISNLMTAAGLAVCVAFSLGAAPAQADQADAIATLQDRLAIEDLLAGYMAAIDSGDAETYASLFAEDGVLSFNGGTYTGHAEILQVMSGALGGDVPGGPPPARRLRHIISGSKITIDGDSARVRSTWATVGGGADGPPAIGAMGYYDDTLVKRDGAWLFAKRDIVVELPIP